MGADDPDSLDLIADLATSLSLEDRNAAVEAVTADALAQNQRVRGPRHPSTVVAMARLARVRESRGELRAAKEILAKASSAKRPASAETQGSSIRLRYHANGQLASWAPGTQDTFGVVPPPGDQHDVDRDIAAVRTLSEAERTILGSTDPGRLESLEWIAKRHLERHQFDSATEARREIVAFFVEQAGPDHWRTIDARANLAAIERMAVVATQAPDLLSSAEHADQQVQIDQASGGVGGRQGGSELQHTLSALVLWRKVLGERAQRCVQYLENMGTILRQQGQLDAAERVLTRVVQLRHDTLGERHPAFAQAIRELGVVLVEKGRAAEAERMLRGAVDRFGAELGKHHAVTAITRLELGKALTLLGDLPGARSECQDALSVLQAMIGERHPACMLAVVELATVLRLQGDYPRALALLEAVQKNLRAANFHATADDPLSRCTPDLASLLGAMGEYARAKTLIEQSVNDQRNSLHAFSPLGQRQFGADVGEGEAHPAYAQRLQTLAELTMELGDGAARSVWPLKRWNALKKSSDPITLQWHRGGYVSPASLFL